jgi:hypothetical protein
MPCVTRADWQQIAEERLLAAEALLKSQRWASAYYLAGYAVEAGLKSCVLVRLASSPEVVFQQGGKKFSQDCWTHDVGKLAELAGIEQDISPSTAANAVLVTNWQVVARWDENSRYEMKSQVDAEELYAAITDSPNGVMLWLKSRW